MAVGKKLEDEISPSSSSSSSMSEALLVATMCIIGLQVHVHIKDASIFSGIFYTISPEEEFSIVLKNAKLTKKGRSKSNVASGKVVETLVILSSNIVQIVAEGVSLSSNVAGEIEAQNVVSAVAVSSEPPSAIANKSTKSGNNRRGANRRRKSAKNEYHLESKVRTLTSGKVNGTADAMKEPGRRGQNKHHPISVNHQRQTGAHILQHSKQNTVVHQDNNVDAQSSSISLDNPSERVKPTDQEKIMPDVSSNGFHKAAERPSSTDNSSSQSTTPDENLEMNQVLVASTNRLPPKQTTDPDKKAKEFKLNPAAKTFSPSLAKRLTTTHAGMTPVVANMGYVPSNTPMLPVPEAGQPEIGISPFLSHAPLPSKFVPYTNLGAGNATGGGYQFPQHVVGPASTNRGPPNRLTTQFHPVQATPMLVTPNPQMMVGRSGQLMYMQPISQDLVQGAPYDPHTPTRPLFSPQQLQYPKHQSLIATGQPMQLYAPAPQPFAASGHHQPYTVIPTDNPVMQPSFPINRATPVPVPNGFYGTKFL